MDLCTDNPDKEIDLFITGDLEEFVSVWMGDIDLRTATKAGKIRLNGEQYMAESSARWFPQSRYAKVRPEHFVNVDGSVGA